MPPSLVDHGAYSLSEASRFAGVPARTVRRWVSGASGLLAPELPPVSGRRAVSFFDLIDLLVVGRFREAGVSLNTIRRVYAHLGERLDARHPFAHQKLLTDGRTIFIESSDHVGDPHLEEVLTGQRAIPAILRPYLSQIEYAPATLLAARWNIASGIQLDPARAFGKPVVSESGTTTFVLARAYRANGDDPELVADLFNVSPSAVRDAVAFESGFSIAAAA